MSIEQSLDNISDSLKMLVQLLREGVIIPAGGGNSPVVVEAAKRTRTKPAPEEAKVVEQVTPPVVEAAPEPDTSDEFDDFDTPTTTYTQDDVRSAVRWIHKLSCATESEGKARALKMLKDAGSPDSSIASLPADKYAAFISAAIAAGYKVA